MGCEHCADAASLRLAFNEASNKMGRVLEGRTAKLPRNWKPSQEDIAWSNAWGNFYTAIKDHQAGLKILSELAYLKPHWHWHDEGGGI